jgi:hypothetical protein
MTSQVGTPKSTTYLSILDDRHNNLAFTRPIARDMARELLHVRHKLRDLGLRRGAAYTSPECNGLACYLSVKRTKEKLLRVGWVEEVEP